MQTKKQLQTPSTSHNLRYAVAAAVAFTCSFGIFTLIASLLTFAGPRSCPFGIPGILLFLLLPLAPGPVKIFFCPA
jgi:hypothetical protein